MRSVIALTVGALVMPAATPQLPADGPLAWRSNPSTHPPISDELEIPDLIGMGHIFEAPNSERVHTAPPDTSVLLDPAPPEIRATYPERCHRWEPTLAAAHQNWDVVRMSVIMWRESRCQPLALSPTSDTGLLQINQVNHEFLSRALGRNITAQSLTDPYLNIAAAAVLCDFWEATKSADCYQPWTATDPGSGTSTESVNYPPAEHEAKRASPRSLENALR